VMAKRRERHQQWSVETTRRVSDNAPSAKEGAYCCCCLALRAWTPTWYATAQLGGSLLSSVSRGALTSHTRSLLSTFSLCLSTAHFRLVLTVTPRKRRRIPYNSPGASRRHDVSFFVSVHQSTTLWIYKYHHGILHSVRSLYRWVQHWFITLERILNYYLLPPKMFVVVAMMRLQIIIETLYSVHMSNRMKSFLRHL
jgi:hypothetical protein